MEASWPTTSFSVTISLIRTQGLLVPLNDSVPSAVLDSKFHPVDSGFQVLDSSLRQWKLDSGYLSLVDFQIP